MSIFVTANDDPKYEPGYKQDVKLRYKQGKCISNKYLFVYMHAVECIHMDIFIHTLHTHWDTHTHTGTHTHTHTGTHKHTFTYAMFQFDIEIYLNIKLLCYERKQKVEQ